MLNPVKGSFKLANEPTKPIVFERWIIAYESQSKDDERLIDQFIDNLRECAKRYNININQSP